MKTFIISSITFIIIISLIIIYILFLNSSINELYSEIDDILNTAKYGSEITEKSIVKLEEKWKNKRKIFESFMYHAKTDRISHIIKDIKLYNELKSTNQVILKSQELKMLLSFIADDEMPTFENII